MTRALARNGSGSSAMPIGCRTIRRSASASDSRARASIWMSRYRSVPVMASTRGRSGCSRRKRSMEAKLRRAWSATIRSRCPPSYCSLIDTRCPNSLRMRAHRSAVTRFPFRECAGAGVMRLIFTREILPLRLLRAHGQHLVFRIGAELEIPEVDLRRAAGMKLQPDRAAHQALRLRISEVNAPRPVHCYPHPAAQREDLHRIPVVLLADLRRRRLRAVDDAAAAVQVPDPPRRREHRQVAVV